MDLDQVAIIQAHPLGVHLDAARALFDKIAGGPGDLDAVSREGKCALQLFPACSDTDLDLQTSGLVLFSAFLNHPASRRLPSRTGHDNLLLDISNLIPALASNTVHPDRIKPLLRAVLARQPDTEIWEQVYHVVTVSTPPREVISSILHTPWRLTTSSTINSSEKRDRMDKLLSEELGVMYIDVPNFYEAFFGGIPELETASEDIFWKCTQGIQPLFRQGWTGWPEDAKQESVLSWLADIVEHFLQWARDYSPTTRRPLARPDIPLEGSVAKRKLDVGLVDDPKADKAARYHWSHILVPGELRSSPNDDIASEAHLDIARYVKEVFTAQPTRRFVLAFTLCGSWMRLWEFDRLGGIASEGFNINEDGRRFVSIILGFVWMDDETLGFDPTIIKSERQQYIEIRKDTKTERLVLDRLIRPAHSIVGRATICWKAYLEGDKSRPFVIKDSWQFPERSEEGKLLEEVTARGVTNVARYYYHKTVRIQAKDDDIQGNVRRGLDITRASNYRTGRARGMRNLTVEAISRNSSTGSKRSSSQTGALLPPSKRSHSGSVSPAISSNETSPNRIHRRIVLCDYGKPIYKASSRPALLGALEGCIKGHKSLYNAGLLHRDISINNLMINEGNKESCLSSFLIDLDLAIKVDRIKASGAKGITGTRAFMAIGILMGEDHTFMDDLESFFWVLFWICIHYNGYGQARVVPEFNEWNDAGAATLAALKKGLVSDDRDFVQIAGKNFTPYYRVLVPWVDKLRRIVFPNGRRWKRVDNTLYSQMRQVLQEGRSDPLVIAN
ncbi:hypothetical protein EKO27_g553 [Xylaria grammica]|uniref:non-specific serine/threonine protein kinase n=1 Tax=Xylaria grammica TaxID=363999 RepID=A0A439DJC9_9PEZI|nr:hypothetical protein EKO27_g553 [Xylaria grammica]